MYGYYNIKRGKTPRYGSGKLSIREVRSLVARAVKKRIPVGHIVKVRPRFYVTVGKMTFGGGATFRWEIWMGWSLRVLILSSSPTTLRSFNPVTVKCRSRPTYDGWDDWTIIAISNPPVSKDRIDIIAESVRDFAIYDLSIASNDDEW